MEKDSVSNETIACWLDLVAETMFAVTKIEAVVSATLGAVLLEDRPKKTT